jgi:hypothetical protein
MGHLTVSETAKGLARLFRSRWSELVVGSAALVAAIMALRPLGGGLSGHDLVWHVSRVLQWHRGLTEGVLYPRFLHDVYAGYGGPVMVFIPPLPYALTEVLVAAGIGPVFALELGVALFLVVGAVGMYFFARPTLGGPAATLSAAAYVIAPYRLLDAYVRLAYSELLATALLPFVLMAMRRVVTRPGGPAVVGGALGTASIILTHASSTVFCLPLSVAYGLWCIRSLETGQRRQAVVRLGSALILGMALSAFYAGPALLEQRYSKLPDAFSSTYQPHEHLLWPAQLIESDWDYGLSIPGPDDTMSFQLGWVHALALVAAAWLAFRGRTPVRDEMRFWLAAAVVALFFMLQVSSWFWQVMPFVSVIQWPWRLMVIVALASSLAVGATVRLISDTAQGSQTALAVAIIALMLPSYFPFTFPAYPRFLDSHISPDMARNPEFLRSETMFMPKGAQIDTSPGPRAAVIDGSADLEIVDDRTHLLVARVVARGPAAIRFRVFDFPGWRASGEGESSAIRRDEIDAIVIDVQDGWQLVTLRYGPTRQTRGAQVVSLGALIAVVAMLLHRRRRPH